MVSREVSEGNTVKIGSRDEGWRNWVDVISRNVTVGKGWPLSRVVIGLSRRQRFFSTELLISSARSPREAMLLDDRSNLLNEGTCSDSVGVPSRFDAKHKSSSEGKDWRTWSICVENQSW